MARLSISRSQIDAPLDGDESFAQSYIDGFMRTHLPGFYWSLSPESRFEMVIQGRHYARSFGIADRHSQMMFITMMWQIGPNFFVFPGFAEVAQVQGLSGPQKIDGFYAVPKPQAIAAIHGADDRWWYPQTLPSAPETILQ